MKFNWVKLNHWIKNKYKSNKFKNKNQTKSNQVKWKVIWVQNLSMWIKYKLNADFFRWDYIFFSNSIKKFLSKMYFTFSKKNFKFLISLFCEEMWPKEAMIAYG